MAEEKFHLVSSYAPTGDQPQAIAELAERIENGENDVVLWVPPVPAKPQPPPG